MKVDLISVKGVVDIEDKNSHNYTASILTLEKLGKALALPWSGICIAGYHQSQSVYI